jgi:DNA ligase-1
MSEKLDGMRAYWTKGRLWTRTGKPIYAPDWFTAGLPHSDDLDGELFLGRQRFDGCVSIARRQNASNEWRQLKYVVFDCPTATGGIVNRLKKAEELLSECGNEFAIIHPHTVCKSEEELMEKLTEIQELGGEGLMLRHPSAAHRGGRTPDLLKVKTFLDDEALIIDHEKGKGKYVGMVGSLICINREGKRFKVGSGLTDDIRSYRSAPQIGQVITFKYFELTKDRIPRFPIYMRIRPDVEASVFPSQV